MTNPNDTPQHFHPIPAKKHGQVKRMPSFRTKGQKSLDTPYFN